MYNEANNISQQCWRVINYKNAICLNRTLLRNPKLISKYQYTTNYLGVPTDRTDDWCFETKGGIITKLRVGGKKLPSYVWHIVLE